MDKNSESSIKPDVIKSRLKFAAFLTFCILCVEVVGGILANNLAPSSDAVHIFADVFALALSWFAIKIARLPSNNEKTYSYHRIEILAAISVTAPC